MGIYNGLHGISVTSTDVSTRDAHGWDMQGHKIVNLKDPDSTADTQTAVTVKFAHDNFVHKKTPPPTDSASSFTNILDNVSINMNGNILFGLPAQQFVDSEAVSLAYLRTHLYDKLCETLLWEYYTRYGTALYRLDRGSLSEVVVDSATRKVSKLYDQSLSENHAEQTTTATQPTLSTSANRNNNRYYLNFNSSQRMLSNIDLNVAAGSQDIVNIFIVYKLNSYTGTYWLRNGLFGHDNSGFDKFVAFSPTTELVVSGTNGDHIVVGANNYNGKNPLGPYQNKANAGDLNKWICLSIHWNVPAGANKSSVWCNGKKLCDFTARTSVGSNQMTFGDLNPTGIAGLDGSIAFFGLYKERVITD